MTIGLGILSMYVFNSSYDYQTGACKGGTFCHKSDHIAECYANHLYTGCLTPGLLAVINIFAIALIVLIIVVPLGLLFRYIYDHTGTYKLFTTPVNDKRPLLEKDIELFANSTN